MANELTISASMKFVKGNKSVSNSKSGVQVDIAGNNFLWQTQVIGTSAEAFNLGEIASPGYILIRNCDSTNFMKVRAGSGGADVVKIKPGKFALFELATATPYGIADTAPVEAEFTLIEA